MFQAPSSPVPSISISFAPHELPQVEPKSPFSVSLNEEPDSPRPQFLLPPSLLSPAQSSRMQRHDMLSPLGSSGSSGGGKGVERHRFEAMLKASRERSVIVGTKKPLELRKEIAIRTQKTKHCERRALFLSKLIAPPSPTAADLPVTPPDSPAVFHFSLPSPGLVSPIEHFEDLANHPELYDSNTTIEQVDFRLPQQKQVVEAARQRHTFVAQTVPSKSLPSLDQISKRLMRSSVIITASPSPSPEHGSMTNNRLPSFLRSRLSVSPPIAVQSSSTVVLPEITKSHRSALRDPTLSVTAKPIGAARCTPVQTKFKEPLIPAVSSSPRSPCPKFQITTTTICPPSWSKSSPMECAEANIAKFGTKPSSLQKVMFVVEDHSQARTKRAQVSKDLFSKLGRRTAGFSGAAACGVRAQDDTSIALSPCVAVEDKLKRRLTAPAEMPTSPRGVRHPILEKPGGF